MSYCLTAIHCALSWQNANRWQSSVAPNHNHWCKLPRIFLGIGTVTLRMKFMRHNDDSLVVNLCSLLLDTRRAIWPQPTSLSFSTHCKHELYHSYSRLFRLDCDQLMYRTTFRPEPGRNMDHQKQGCLYWPGILQSSDGQDDGAKSSWNLLFIYWKRSLWRSLLQSHFESLVVHKPMIEQQNWW